MDVWDLIEQLDAGPEQLARALDQGADPNLSCKYTGMTALLSACEKNRLPDVLRLLAAGANPNCQHNDGYNCYDSTREPAIRQVLLQQGFRLVVPVTQSGRDFAGCRLLAPVPVNQSWELPLQNPGREFCFEYQLYASPVPAGTLELEVGPGLRRLSLVPGEPCHVREDLVSETGICPMLFFRAEGFCGEIRVRLYDLSLLASELAPLLTAPWPAG